MNEVYIALGSNLDNPLAQVTTAVVEIDQLPETSVKAKSRWYLSKPLLANGQDDVVNGVILISTNLTPGHLLHSLQQIENVHKRQRTIRWGARTLDLDILLYNHLIMHTPELTIPHPEIPNRNFVLLPLADINPELLFPDGTSLEILLENCSTAGIVALCEGGQRGIIE